MSAAASSLSPFTHDNLNRFQWARQFAVRSSVGQCLASLTDMRRSIAPSRQCRVLLLDAQAASTDQKVARTAARNERLNRSPSKLRLRSRTPAAVPTYVNRPTSRRRSTSNACRTSRFRTGPVLSVARISLVQDNVQRSEGLYQSNASVAAPPPKPPGAPRT